MQSQDSKVLQSLSRSHLRFLSPQNTIERPSTILPRETIQSNLAQSQFLGSARETVIPLDVQYTVTKKVEQHNFSDYEVRIQSLSHEVELWRRRYLELMAAHDKNVANEEIIKLQQSRILLLTKENEELYNTVKALMNENDKLKLALQDQDLVTALQKSQADYDDLQTHLKERLDESAQWREKYSKLEDKLKTYEKVESDLLATQSLQEGIEGQAQIWQDRYWRMMQNRDALQNQLKSLNDKLNATNYDIVQRTNATELKLKDYEIARLKQQIKSLQDQVEEWRRRALRQETELDLKDQEIEGQQLKHQKLLEQINKLNAEIGNREKEIMEKISEIKDLDARLREIDSLKQELENLAKIIQKKDADNVYLRKELARLENANSELRHEKLLKVQFEQENKRILENCQQYQQESNDRKSLLDALKIKFGNLEIRCNELTQQLDQSKFLQLQIDKLKGELKAAQNRIAFLQQNNQQQLAEIQELQARVQQLKFLEVDSKRLQELVGLKDNEIQTLRKRVAQLELVPKGNNSSELEEKIKSLSELIESLKSEYAAATEKSDKYFSENMLLSQRVVSMEMSEQTEVEDKTEANQWKLKFLQASSENEHLLEQKQQLQADSDFLAEQLRALQKQLNSRRQEVEDWRRQAGAYYVDCTENKKQLADLEKLRESLSQENKQLANENSELKTRVGQLQNEVQKTIADLTSLELQSQGQINSLDQEKQLLKIKLTEANVEVDKWREKYLKSEQLNHDLKGINEKYDFTTAQLALAQEDNARLNQTLRNSIHPHLEVPKVPQEFIQKQLEDLQSRYDKQTQEFIHLSTEVTSLKQQLADKDTRHLEQRVEELLKEIQRINLAYQNKVRESEELRNRSNILQSTVSDLRYLEKRVPDLQNHINNLSRNISDNLNEISLLNTDIDKLNQKIARQQLQLKSYQALQQEHALLKSNYNEKQQAIAKQNTQIYLLEGDLKNTSLQREDFFNKYGSQASENQDLKAINSSKQVEIEKITRRLAITEVKSLEADRLAQRVKQLEGQQLGLNDEISRLKRESNELNGDLEAAKKLNDQLQFKLNQLAPFKKQVSELQGLLHRDQDVQTQTSQQLAQALAAKNSAIKEVQQTQKQLHDKELQLQEKTNIMQEIESQLDNSLSQINNLTEKVNQLQTENFNYQVMNQNLNLRIKKAEIVEQDYLKLRELYEQAIDQINDLKHKLSVKEAEASSFQTIKEGLEARVALLASEIERLSHMLKTKNDEIETQKESISRLEAMVIQLSALEGDARRTEEQLIQLKSQNEAVKENLSQKAKESDEFRVLKETLENKVALLSGEIEELKKAVTKGELRNEEAMLVIQRQEDELVALKQLQGANNELAARLVAQQQLNDQLREQSNAKNQELLQAKQKINDLESQIQQLKQGQLEESKLRSQLVTLGKEKDEWLVKIDQLQRQVEKLERAKSDLEAKCAMLASEVERLNNKHKVSQSNNQTLQDQITYLKDDIERLTNQLQDTLSQNDDLRKRQFNPTGSFLERSLTLRGGQFSNN